MMRTKLLILAATCLATAPAFGQVPCGITYVPLGTDAPDTRFTVFGGAATCLNDQPLDRDKSLGLSLMWEHFNVALGAGFGVLGSGFGRDGDIFSYLNFNYRAWGGVLLPISIHIQPGFALLQQDSESQVVKNERTETRIPLRFFLNWNNQAEPDPFDENAKLLDNPRFRAWIGPLFEWARVEIADDAESKFGWGFIIGGAVELRNQLGIMIDLEYERVGFKDKASPVVPRKIKRWTLGFGLYLIIDS